MQYLFRSVIIASVCSIAPAYGQPQDLETPRRLRCADYTEVRTHLQKEYGESFAFETSVAGYRVHIYQNSMRRTWTSLIIQPDRSGNLIAFACIHDSGDIHEKDPLSEAQGL